MLTREIENLIIHGNVEQITDLLRSYNDRQRQALYTEIDSIPVELKSAVHSAGNMNKFKTAVKTVFRERQQSMLLADLEQRCHNKINEIEKRYTDRISVLENEIKSIKDRSEHLYAKKIEVWTSRSVTMSILFTIWVLWSIYSTCRIVMPYPQSKS